MRNGSYEQQRTTRRMGDDRSAQTRLASRAIDCGHDCVHDGELEPPRQNATPVVSGEPGRPTR
jgi:hypothetical protein